MSIPGAKTTIVYSAVQANGRGGPYTKVRARHHREESNRSPNESAIVRAGGWSGERMNFTVAFFDKPVMYRLPGLRACCSLCEHEFKRPLASLRVFAKEDADCDLEEPADAVVHADNGLINEAAQHAVKCTALPDLFESAMVEELGLTPEQVRALEPNAQRALLDHYWESSPAVLVTPALWRRKP